MANSLDADELARAIDHLQAALVAAKKREAKKAATKQAADLKKLAAMVAKMGLSAADVKKLMATSPKHKRAVKNHRQNATGRRKSKKVAPQYQLKMGKEIYKWTDRGRMQLLFSEFTGKSDTLDRRLIKKPALSTTQLKKGASRLFFFPLSPSFEKISAPCSAPRPHWTHLPPQYLPFLKRSRYHTSY